MLNFSKALEELKEGKCISRTGWNGKSRWIVLVRDWTVEKELSQIVEGLLPIPFIAMKTVDNNFVPWLASQTDIMANDWNIIE
jgi:hypothetical protein